MRGPATGYDWIRVILMAAVALYLGHQIYHKTNMLLKWEMGFTEEAVDSDTMRFPSVTICPGYQDERKWLNKVGNITADFQNLPRIEDMLVEVIQPISINK